MNSVGKSRIFIASKGLLAAGLVLFLQSAAAEGVGTGREIYQRLCEDCHGSKGEGVAGKHREPLIGDLTLPALTRKIERTMPDDDPGACVGEDAVAVATYIYQTFYSTEARARSQKARVDLVRLTNRQYLTTVADLIAPFVGDPNKGPSEPGLRGEYHASRGFGGDRRVFERIDAPIRFEFGLESPDPERIAPEEFAIRWRGSLFAPETGDYEFALATPNGARLWLNDDDSPLIDAWVASGGVNEHQASIRLLGGRAYPIRLEFFKSKDLSASITLEWIPPKGVREPIPARNLSTAGARPIVVVTTPFPPDDSSVGYERGSLVSRAWDEATTQAAIDVANHVARSIDALAVTRPEAEDRPAKIRAFCHQLVASAFRRPLTPDESRELIDARLADAADIETAIKKITLFALKSPWFLYLGLNSGAPDPYEIASRLSFALWDSLPDEPLLRAAASGELNSADEARRQAVRMLDDPRTRSKVRYCLHQWLQVTSREDLSKDLSAYPGFSDRIIADLRTSLDLFLDEVVWSERSDYRDLLLDSHLHLNHRLAAYYGIETDAGEEFIKVALPPDQRCGVLTHPFLLAAFSYPRSSSPIHRGVFLTRNIIGRTLNPPPNAVEFKESAFDPGLTMREKVVQLTRPDACRTCHAVINPLGFSLEHYDGVGRYRSHDGEHPVDASGDYPTPDGSLVRLTGARDLATFASDNPTAHAAFVEVMFHQVVKQPTLAYGPQVLNHLRHLFETSAYSVRQLLVEIALTAALHDLDASNHSSLTP